MIDLLELHKYFILNHLKEGDVAVDFTMGNGYDTEFLSKTVGESGHVYAFDIQKAAVESTAKRLLEVGCPQNYTLIHDSHHKVKDYVKTPFKAGMFNLGWLPGGDKSIHTLRESTLPAVFSAIKLLKKGGLVTINVYPGHAEGKCEGELLMQELSKLSKFEYCVFVFRLVNSPEAPFIIGIEKYNK